MKYMLQTNDGSPAYLQLYRQLREDITNELYAFGSRLPSKRNLAGDLGVSTVTIEHAYALLCDEGYAEARERSGYFVIFKASDGFAGYSPGGAGPSKFKPLNADADTRTDAEAKQERIEQAREFLSPDYADRAFSKSYPEQTHPLFRPDQRRNDEYTAFSYPILAKAMRRVMGDYAERLLVRSPNSGLHELKSAIGQYLARSRGIRVLPEQIIIGSGSEYLYGLIVELFGRSRIYAIESPSYQKIEQVYRASDVEYEMLPLGEDGIKSEALWAAHADILHITPYRSFPSGVTATASKRHEYLRWAEGGEHCIIEDDFESEFSVLKKPEETLFSHAQNVIYMNTFSKTISPALRVGYMVLPTRLLPEFEQKLGFYSCTVPTFEQLVLAELIRNGDFERHINRVRRALRRAAQESRE